MDTAMVISVLGSIRTADTTAISALAFLIFDHLLTFTQEVDLFWKPKLTGAAAIFFFNRYIVLVTLLLDVSGIFVAVPPESCAPMVIATNIFAMLQYIPWAVFAAKRAFALSSRNRLFTFLILLLSLTPVGADIAHFAFGLNGENDLTFGCVVVDPIDPGLSQKLTIISRSCLIVADLLLIVATWVTVSRTIRKGILATEEDAPATFGAVLLRDGALYFLALLLLNSLHITLTVLSLSEVAFQHASFVLQFVHPITGILVSRFLLDLQSANRESLHLDSTLAAHQTETIVFGRAVFTLETSDTLRSLKHASVDSISVYSQ